MKKLMSLLLLTFLSLPYLAWGMEIDDESMGIDIELVDETLFVYKIGPSQSNSKLPAESYENLGYKDPDKDIKFEFWYMDNKKIPFYVKFNPQDKKWIELKSGDRLFSSNQLRTLCCSFCKYKTDAASEYQCFDFSKSNKVFVQLIDGKFSGQVGTAPGGEKTAKALAFIGSKTPFRGKIRTTLSGLSLANNIKNDDIKVAFTVRFPPNFTKQIPPDSTEESDLEEFPPDFTEDNIKTLVDPYVNRDLEGNDIVTLELLGDASQHKITRQEANNSKTLKNILADIGAESIIPVIGINPTVIDSVIAVLVDPSKTRMLLDAYWKNGKFDEFIQFINAISYLNIKDAIKILKDEYSLTAEIPPVDEMTSIEKSIILDIIQAIKDYGNNFIGKTFRCLPIALRIETTLQNISFNNDTIKTTIQVLKKVWGQDSEIFNHIIRFLVYRKEDLIMDHFNDFDKNIRGIINRHLSEKGTRKGPRR